MIDTPDHILVNKVRNSCGLIGILALAMASPGIAQEADDSDAVEEVVVYGIRSSIENAINSKRNASQIMDAISAEDIGKLADDNIGEALQRVTGVSLTREAGEGKEISIRGLGAGLSQVTVNGQKIANTEGNRNANLSVLDSSLVSALEVWKSPVASQDEGSVGGTVNLVIRGPLDSKRTRGALVAGGQLEHLPSAWGGKYNGTFVTQNDAQTFGFGISANYSDRESRSDQVIIPGWTILDATSGDWSSRGWDQLAATEGLDHIIYPIDMSSRIRTYDRTRSGVNPTFQWRLSDTVDIRLDGYYSQLEDFDTNQSIQVRIRDLVRGGGRNANDYVWEFDGNTAVFFDTAGATIGNGWRGLRTRGSLRKNKWQSAGTRLRIDWAPNDKREYAFQIGSNSGEGDLLTFPVASFEESTGFAVDLRNDPRFPQGNVENGFTDAQLDLRSVSINDRFNEEHSEFAQLDFTNYFDGNVISAIRYGIKYHQEDLSRLQVRHVSNRGVSGTLDDFALRCYGTPCSVSHLTYGGTTATPFDGTFTQVDFGLIQEAYPRDSREDRIAYDESWKTDESTLAAYVQVDLDGEMFGLPFSGNFGVRYFTTDLTSSGWLDSVGIMPGQVDRTYNDVLPSLNLTLTAQDDLLFRFGLSRVMARPDQEDLSFGGNFNLVDQTARVGNPLLEPFQATAFDLGVEWYFAPAGLLSGAVFYKDIDAFISNGVIEGGIIVDTPSGPLTFDAVGPINGEGAKVKGVEVGYQQAFDFLPFPFDGLGTQVNYTYTDSTVEIPYIEGGQSFAMPLEGLSKSSYNAVIYYERERFSARLAYNYRDKFLSNRSNTQGNPVFSDDYAQLDASVNFHFTDKLGLSLSVINLNEEARYQYFLTPDRMLAQRASGRRFSFVFRARF